jgi:hypothetical protein
MYGGDGRGVWQRHAKRPDQRARARARAAAHALLAAALWPRPGCTHPMVVMKLGVKLSSENRSSRQLFPTPAWVGGQRLGPFS